MNDAFRQADIPIPNNIPYIPFSERDPYSSHIYLYEVQGAHVLTLKSGEYADYNLYFENDKYVISNKTSCSHIEVYLFWVESEGCDMLYVGPKVDEA